MIPLDRRVPATPGCTVVEVSAGFAAVRQATESDRLALSEMFARCSADTRYRRFHGGIGVLPGNYLNEALSCSPAHFALVAAIGTDWGADPAGGTVVALASCRSTSEDAAELGLLVEDAWQRAGVGSALLREIVGHARRSGISLLTAQILTAQSWMIRLLSGYGSCESVTARGITDVKLRLNAVAGRA
jgi:GNAT superfamily N-acetyltransferase